MILLPEFKAPTSQSVSKLVQANIELLSRNKYLVESVQTAVTLHATDANTLPSVRGDVLIATL